MGSFWTGAIVGVAMGAAGAYAALERPWAGSETTAAVSADAGPRADEASGRSKRKKRRKKRRRRRKGTDEVRYVDEVVELSAAERQSIWRGPKVSLPPKDVDFAGGGGRPLNQSEIDAGIRSGRSAMVRCIGDSRGNAELRATITVKFLVDESGSVSTIRMRAPRYLFDNGFQACAARAVRSMRFPSTGAATVVTVPFELS